jgi:hypothetical protein
MEGRFIFEYRDNWLFMGKGTRIYDPFPLSGILGWDLHGLAYGVVQTSIRSSSTLTSCK